MAGTPGIARAESVAMPRMIRGMEAAHDHRRPARTLTSSVNGRDLAPASDPRCAAPADRRQTWQRPSYSDVLAKFMSFRAEAAAQSCSAAKPSPQFLACHKKRQWAAERERRLP